MRGALRSALRSAVCTTRRTAWTNATRGGASECLYFAPLCASATRVMGVIVHETHRGRTLFRPVAHAFAPLQCNRAILSAFASRSAPDVPRLVAPESQCTRNNAYRAHLDTRWANRQILGKRLAAFRSVSFTVCSVALRSGVGCRKMRWRARAGVRVRGWPRKEGELPFSDTDLADGALARFACARDFFRFGVRGRKSSFSHPACPSPPQPLPLWCESPPVSPARLRRCTAYAASTK